jgi:hypothetical protein
MKSIPINLIMLMFHFPINKLKYMKTKHYSFIVIKAVAHRTSNLAFVHHHILLVDKDQNYTYNGYFLGWDVKIVPDTWDQFFLTYLCWDLEPFHLRTETGVVLVSSECWKKDKLQKHRAVSRFTCFIKMSHLVPRSKKTNVLSYQNQRHTSTP